MATINDNQIYSVKEIASRLDMSARGVLRLIHEGHLLAGRAGRKYLILGKNVANFLSQNQKVFAAEGKIGENRENQ